MASGFARTVLKFAARGGDPRVATGQQSTALCRNHRLRHWLAVGRLPARHPQWGRQSPHHSGYAEYEGAPTERTATRLPAAWLQPTRAPRTRLRSEVSGGASFPGDTGRRCRASIGDLAKGRIAVSSFEDQVADPTAADRTPMAVPLAHPPGRASSAEGRGRAEHQEVEPNTPRTLRS